MRGVRFFRASRWKAVFGADFLGVGGYAPPSGSAVIGLPRSGMGKSDKWRTENVSRFALPNVILEGGFAKQKKET